MLDACHVFSIVLERLVGHPWTWSFATLVVTCSPRASRAITAMHSLMNCRWWGKWTQTTRRAKRLDVQSLALTSIWHHASSHRWHCLLQGRNSRQHVQRRSRVCDWRWCWSNWERRSQNLWSCIKITEPASSWREWDIHQSACGRFEPVSESGLVVSRCRSVSGVVWCYGALVVILNCVSYLRVTNSLRELWTPLSVIQVRWC